MFTGQPEICSDVCDGVTYDVHLFFTVIPMDYGAPSTVLMFAACETRSCVNVTIVDDLVDELEEILNVTLERTPGLDSRITLYPVDGQIVIIDNDGISEYTMLITQAIHLLHSH